MSRRPAFLIAAGLLVAVLVGGRWLALETAERAWAATFPGGSALVEARTLARLLHALVLLFSITWTTGNVFVVYRAIGSVQMPRRLGDLEIVEAVPQPVLLALTVGTGVVGGIILAWGTGDWWRVALLAAAPPHFGQTDRILGLDVGYYVGVLPWHSTLQGHAMALTVGAAVVVGLLYAGIGSLRIQRGRLHASDHARAHCAVLLACLALVIAWGATLDPAEVVGGLHGAVDQAVLTVRLPGAAFVAAVAVATALASLAWGWRDRPNLLLGAWAALLLTVAACYLIVPGIVRASASGGGEREGEGTGAALVQRRAALEREAFGLATLERRAPPGFASADAAVRGLPLWDAGRVATVTGTPANTVALRPGRGWLIAPLAGTGGPHVAVETDTGLVVDGWARGGRARAADTAIWFGPGLGELAVASPDTWPALRGAGIAVAGAWRRWALAQTLQSFELMRAETDGRVLLWRRDVTDRLARLAPFASFGEAAPAVVDSALWWVSWGYVASETFPLARALPWRDRPVRFLGAGLVGAVRAGTGETRLWLAPGSDSLTAAWARHFDPLIEPLARMPAALRVQLVYPPELFEIAAAQLVRASGGDSAVWTLRPPKPYRLAAPGGEPWTGIGIETGRGHRFVGVLAGAMTLEGPRLCLWQPGAPERLPAELVGSSGTHPGELRIWPAGGAVLTLQAQFAQPTGERARPHLERVYISLGERTGEGPTAVSALRALVTGQGRPLLADTSLAARWERARRLVAQADSALAAGNLQEFGRLYRELVRLLAPAPRPR